MIETEAAPSLGSRASRPQWAAGPIFVQAGGTPAIPGGRSAAIGHTGGMVAIPGGRRATIGRADRTVAIPGGCRAAIGHAGGTVAIAPLRPSSSPNHGTFAMSHDDHEGTSTSGTARRFVEDPGRIETLVADMRASRLSSEALVTRYLARIAEVEEHVRAWRVVDSDRALEDARALDEEAAEGRFRGALHGLPVAIKDVMDVEGLPTRCNSPALQDRAPATADAEVVRALRAAGAVVLGKAHTTEYAFFDPSPARNPHHTDHTPGGSSSGSAAAVACGAAPAATGTQTVASVNRPAAYCGVAAFKPSTGLLSTYGVTPLAPMFDTVGFFGRRVADAAVLFEAVCPAHAAPRRGGATDDRLTVIALDDPFLAQSVPAVQQAMASAADRLREAGHEVIARNACVSFETLSDGQRRCMLYQTGKVHRSLLDLPGGQAGEKIREAVEMGVGIADDEFRAMHESLTAARRRLYESGRGRRRGALARRARHRPAGPRVDRRPALHRTLDRARRAGGVGERGRGRKRAAHRRAARRSTGDGRGLRVRRATPRDGDRSLIRRGAALRQPRRKPPAARGAAGHTAIGLECGTDREPGNVPRQGRRPAAALPQATLRRRQSSMYSMQASASVTSA